MTQSLKNTQLEFYYFPQRFFFYLHEKLVSAIFCGRQCVSHSLLWDTHHSKSIIAFFGAVSIRLNVFHFESRITSLIIICLRHYRYSVTKVPAGRLCLPLPCRPMQNKVYTKPCPQYHSSFSGLPTSMKN